MAKGYLEPWTVDAVPESGRSNGSEVKLGAPNPGFLFHA